MNQTLDIFMKNLPLELYVKIMYKSGLCSPEAQLIKDMNNRLFIPYENVVWMHGGKSYINHLIDMGVLSQHYNRFIEYLFIVG